MIQKNALIIFSLNGTRVFSAEVVIESLINAKIEYIANYWCASFEPVYCSMLFELTQLAHTHTKYNHHSESTQWHFFSIRQSFEKFDFLPCWWIVTEAKQWQRWHHYRIDPTANHNARGGFYLNSFIQMDGMCDCIPAFNCD